MPPAASSPAVLAAARRCLDWLAATDPLPAEPCDAIVGFGVFDLALPRFCGELHRRGVAPFLIFTGGLGAGTGSLGGPEADAWRAELRRTYPEIGDDRVFLENRSTNTAENVAFTAARLARERPALAFGTGLRTVVAVASPSRLRRVLLTLRHLQPDVRVVRRLPPFSFESESALYTAQGTDYLGHLCGELDRIADYPRRGWIAPDPLPPALAADHALLRSALAPAHPA